MIGCHPLSTSRLCIFQTFRATTVRSGPNVCNAPISAVARQLGPARKLTFVQPRASGSFRPIADISSLATLVG